MYLGLQYSKILLYRSTVVYPVFAPPLHIAAEGARVTADTRKIKIAMDNMKPRLALIS
jgi:hypothetical protein